MTTEVIIQMSAEQARIHLDRIRANVEGIRLIVLELYERRGWAALGYATWRECVVAEFARDKSYLYRQLQAALIEREVIDNSPMGEKPQPIPERQLRPLTALPEGERKTAWKEAKATAPDGKVTSRHVQETVDRKLGKEPITNGQQPPTGGKSRVNGVLTEDPPEIAKARANGRIAADVIPDVETSEPEETPEPEPMKNVEAELDDPTWLATLPVRAKLSPTRHKGFDADALLYRRLEGPRRSFLSHAQKALKAARRFSSDGAYAYLLSRFLRADHPKHWILCPATEHGGCAGTGEIPLIGQCPKCHGRGFWIK